MLLIATLASLPIISPLTYPVKSMCRFSQCRPVPSCRKQRQAAAALAAIPAITLSILLSAVAGQAAEISSGSGVVIGGKGEVLNKRPCCRGMPNYYREGRSGEFGSRCGCRE